MMKEKGISPVWYDDTNRGMQIHHTDGVTWLSFPAFDRLGFVRNGFSTRLGGVSRDCFATMNLSFTRGDNEEDVRENFRRIGRAAGFAPESMVLSDQVHKTNVRKVDKKDCGSGYTKPKDFHETDGLITDTPGVTLATFYADCVPLYFADPVHHAIGLSHSGWRGTEGRIGEVTLKKMGTEFGSRPDDMICGIGPSVCFKCYEVSADVAERFLAMFDPKYHADILLAKPNNKYQLNLWEANRRILIEAGVKPENIHIAGLCTSCNPDFLYSHRKSGDRRGNLGAFLEMV